MFYLTHFVLAGPSGSRVAHCRCVPWRCSGVAVCRGTRWSGCSEVSRPALILYKAGRAVSGWQHLHRRNYKSGPCNSFAKLHLYAWFSDEMLSCCPISYHYFTTIYRIIQRCDDTRVKGGIKLFNHSQGMKEGTIRTKKEKSWRWRKYRILFSIEGFFRSEASQNLCGDYSINYLHYSAHKQVGYGYNTCLIKKYFGLIATAGWLSFQCLHHRQAEGCRLQFYQQRSSWKRGPWKRWRSLGESELGW